MTELGIYCVARVADNGRWHRSRRANRYAMGAGDPLPLTLCGLTWSPPSTLLTLEGVGEIAADPNRFLCERCFGRMLRDQALNAYYARERARADPTALLREAGQAARDAGEALKPPAPDRFIRWESGEVWDWTWDVVQQVMFAKAFGHSLDTGDRPRPFPKPAAPPRPTLGLPHYRLSYRDGAGASHQVEKVLAYRYWNTGECSVAVVAKEGGVADWGAYIGALPNVKPQGNAITGPWVSEEEVVAHVIREGNKLTWDEASAFFGGDRVDRRGIGLRCGQAPLPMEAYRK